jgi:hypothetical protein
VTTIGEHAFAGCERLSSINLPAEIKTIQAYTFQNCKSLTSIDIPETVTIIQKDAFYNTAIKDLIIPEGVVEIEDGAFSNVKLDTLSLPKSLKKIGPYSFSRNYKEYIGTLTPGNVDCYAHYATKDKNVFKGLSHSCPMVDLPDTVRFIDTFGSVGSLKKITLNEGLVGICDKAFHNSYLLAIELPDTVETIGAEAFAARSLQQVKLSKGIKKIPRSAFSSCVALTSIEVPEGVIELGECTFTGCEKLKTVKLPSTLQKIGKAALTGRGQILIFSGTPPAIEDDLGRECEVRYYAKHAAAWEAIKDKRPWKDAKLVEMP